VNALTRKSIQLLSPWLLLAAALAATLATTHEDQWHPLGLVALLLVLAVIGDRQIIPFGNQNVSGAFVALVLAMTLLGPAPAALLGVLATVVDSLSRRPSFADCLYNMSIYAAFPLLGGLLTEALVGDVHNAAGIHESQSMTFALAVLAVFLVTNLVNFALVAIHQRIVEGQGLVAQVRFVLIPILPGQVATAALAAILAVAYTNLGYPALIGMVAIILIYQYLALALRRSEDRAEQLEARSVRLASMQLGMLVTLMETLALRDRMTARHAAAVARYARALAREVGASEADQELAHTAGLLHDIGKFALPDRILHAEVLSDEDWAVIRRHPQDGATLVGRLDGYGPVADAILYHHEHMDGSGYPAGLIGNEIPLPSRILAICSAYDTMTARDTYRSPMTPQDAMTELRRVAGRQFDSELVSSFITMLEREGPVTFAHGDDADFEAELNFERRARAMAQPATQSA
jgi:putative nucleotidyltransferase with HDIG domain